jgi:hypothetical protein
MLKSSLLLRSFFLAAINAGARGIRYYEADGRSANRSDN